MMKNDTTMLITVGVIFGGRSVEHEVSVMTGLRAIKNLDKETYNIVPVYISKEGVWYTGDALLDMTNYKQLDKLLADSPEVFMTPKYNDNTLYFKNYPTTLNVDILLLALLGATGENGAFQGFCEFKGIPFAGCGTLASAVCMDKVFTKFLLESQNLPFVPYRYFYDFEWYTEQETIIEKIKTTLSFPVVVKPADQGSSVGVTKATSETELIEAVRIALQFTNKVLVDKAIQPLKEVNCSVMGDVEEPKPSLLEEPKITGELLSYHDKYVRGVKSAKMNVSSRNISRANASGATVSDWARIPADINETLTAQIRECAVAVFRTMNCSGVVRIDFLLDVNQNSFYVNEINTIPSSLSSYIWEPSGVAFKDVLDKLIKTGIKRWREQQQHVSSYTDFNLFTLSSFASKK